MSELSAQLASPPRSVLMGLDRIRCRAQAITRWVSDGHSPWWRIDRDQMAEASRVVAELTRERFPDLRVPFHSRWRHFEAGGLDRGALLRKAFESPERPGDPMPLLRAQIDLCMVSVLLDAGAGPNWRFIDRGGHPHVRSEGLAVASFEAFMRGDFSGDVRDPMRIDAQVLSGMDASRLAGVFQHRLDNPLAGLDGRIALMNRLGIALQARQLARPSDLYAPLIQASTTAARKCGAPDQRVTLHVAELLAETVSALATVWLLASEAPDGARGDLWPHPAARDESSHGVGDAQGWMPFHKLSQWLCYSLIEPLRDAGVVVAGLETLTGLPEYRNGGLLVDTGVISLRDAQWASQSWTPDDPLVIEWRALTVSLIDELADHVRARLGVDAHELPLACILEGGTWAAGRRLAERLRGGRPPIEVDTAGSVF